jgi:hypothetical protein
MDLIILSWNVKKIVSTTRKFLKTMTAFHISKQVKFST